MTIIQSSILKWTVAGLIFAFLLFFCASLKGQEIVEVPIGSSVIGSMPVCDRADQWARVLAKRDAEGLSAAVALYKKISVEERLDATQFACGSVQGVFILKKVMWEGVVEGIPMAIVEVEFSTPNSEKSITLYSYFENAKMLNLKGARES